MNPKPTKNTCKYMKTKNNWTPNDFDLKFNTEDIPSNIRTEDTGNLTQRLQKKYPLSKKIHLDLDQDTRTINNTLTTYTRLELKINNTRTEIRFL